MNDMEFKELQTEFGKMIFSYEAFCKKGYLLDIEYNYHFHDYIEKEYRLLEENELLKNVVLMLKEKKSLAEIEKHISDTSVKYNKNIVALRNKAKNSEHIYRVGKELSLEVVSEFEKEFKEYLMENHPAVKIMISPQEKAVYNQLRSFYFENNYGSYSAFLDLNRKVIQPSLLTADKYDMAAKYYYNTMGEIRLDMNKKKNTYPYNKEEVFLDEMNLAAEEADFKIRLNALLGINKSLHQDVMEVYGEDICL